MKWRFLILFSSIFYFSCFTSKNYIDFNLVEQGSLLYKASEIELPDFIPVWMENNNSPKIDFNLNELYKDSVFTYFGKRTFKNQSFYKIKNVELIEVNYKSINGDSLRRKFINEVIPQVDKNKVLKKSKGCTTGFTSHDFKYKYIGAENSIEIKCRWKEKCDFINKLIDKEYIAKYNIESKRFY